MLLKSLEQQYSTWHAHCQKNEKLCVIYCADGRIMVQQEQGVRVSRTEFTEANRETVRDT